jgi:hypothetical protein
MVYDDAKEDKEKETNPRDVAKMKILGLLGK